MNPTTSSDNEPSPDRRQLVRGTRPFWIWIGFALISLSYNAFFLKAFQHWWMDDDPRNFAAARSVASPLTFFVDRAVAKDFSVTNTVSPMLGLSMWLDSHLAYRSILFAQLHNLLLLTATLVFLFAVMRRCGLSSLGAFGTCLIWLFLPATGIVSEWLAARHHLEGVTWSLAAVVVTQRLALGEWRENVRSIGLLLLLLAFAALSKETSVITSVGCSLYLWHRGRRFAAISCGALLLTYLGYRFWLVGFTAGEGYYTPLPNLAAFVQFLSQLPYILVRNSGGYILILLVVFAVIVGIAKQEVKPRSVLYAMMLMACCLFVMARGALPLQWFWRDPGTWYRLVFFFGTGLLVASAYVLTRVYPPYLGYVAFALALPIAVAGGMVTQKKWDRLAKHYEAEGKFYLSHPDRLLYSEVPAGWYIGSIGKLYAIEVSHYIIANHQPGRVAEQMAGHSEIWRYANGTFVVAPQLFLQLKAESEQNTSVPAQTSLSQQDKNEN